MKTSDLNNSMQVLKENKLSVCKLPTPLPGRCSWLGTCKCLAPHLGLLPGKALRSIFVIFMAFCSCGSWSKKSKLNTMCPAGIWSQGGTYGGPCSHRLPPPSAHSPPDSNAWCSSTNPQVSVPTSCKIMQTSQQHTPVETRNTSVSSYYKACPQQ